MMMMLWQFWHFPGDILIQIKGYLTSGEGLQISESLASVCTVKFH